LFTILPALLLLCGPALGADATVAAETSLRASPEGAEILAFVTSGTPAEVLEQREGWARVSIEGWVRSDVLEGGQPAPAAATPAPPQVEAVPATPAPAVVAAAPPAMATADAATGVPVEGVVRVKLGRFKKASAEREPVLLLPAGVELTDTESPETDRRMAEIEAEAARLKREAEIAMQGPSFRESTAARDKLMKERDVVLAERQEILMVRHGRHEAEARRLALVTGTTDSKGWFRLSTVEPGEYTVYTRLTRENVDLEWLEPITVGSAPLSLEFGEDTARGMLPK
jgi:hypothetical protein